jgi:uncharacterized coiled-coil DUF342 family protein
MMDIREEYEKALERVEAERDALKAEVEQWKSECDKWVAKYEPLRDERDALKAALRKEYDQRIQLMWRYDALKVVVRAAREWDELASGESAERLTQALKELEEK